MNHDAAQLVLLVLTVLLALGAFIEGRAAMRAWQAAAAESANAHALHLRVINQRVEIIERLGACTALLKAAQEAEGFITGFEDDETQIGVPQLLADLRSALDGVRKLA